MAGQLRTVLLHYTGWDMFVSYIYTLLDKLLTATDIYRTAIDVKASEICHTCGV